VVDIKRTGGNVQKAMKVSQHEKHTTPVIGDVRSMTILPNSNSSSPPSSASTQSADMPSQFFLLTQTWYTITNGFNKMTFLALYYRVFPMKQFRRSCIALGVISTAWTVSFVYGCLFQCRPIQRVYNRGIPETCISFAGHW
jgi:hypothetical protein